MTDAATVTDDEVRELAERRGFAITRPWEFSPWEVNEGPCPFRSDAGEHWEQAQRLRAELVAEIEAAKRKARAKR